MQVYKPVATIIINEILRHKQRGILIDDSNPTPQPAHRKTTGGGAAGNFTQALSSGRIPACLCEALRRSKAG